MYGCVGSSFPCEGFLQLWQAGATLHRSARAPHRRGLSRCGAQAPDAQAQQLWPTGRVAPRHAGSSQTRARTHVPCIGRRTPNHCATGEAQFFFFFSIVFSASYHWWICFFCCSLLSFFLLFLLFNFNNFFILITLYYFILSFFLSPFYSVPCG